MTKFSRFILSVSLLFILITQYITFINTSNNTIKVFNEATKDINSYNYYILKFNDELSTKNIGEYFKYLSKEEYQIKSLTPKINNAWNNDLKNTLKNISYTNMDEFLKIYVGKLEKYKLEEEINNAKIDGIKIDSALIYTSKENIKILSSYHKNLEYKEK